jgi:4'-phosphopantetheinyl transferase
MVQWLEALSDWSRALPAALVVRGASHARRRALLKALAAQALRVEPGSIIIEHRAQAAPELIQPGSEGLFLSSASRGDWAVVAIARAPIGVDVEEVDSAGEIPWNVLHPAEVDLLRSHKGEARARAFARLWSVKEAYVKALRAGLREAESFAVGFSDSNAEAALISDPFATAQSVYTSTVWRTAQGRYAAVSTVVQGASS